MTTAQRLAQLDDLDALTARLSPAGLAWIVGDKATTPEQGWVPYPHLELLSKKLMAVAAGEIDRLIVTMPPRHGKSELISRFTPAWFLGTHPDRKVMLASYEATFAKSWGRKAREILEEYGPAVFGVEVSQSSSAADYWEIAGHEGVMTTAGVGGPLTGKGAHLMIIDDPVKNHEEALSEVMREKAWDWWVSTARTRLQMGGGVVLVMTRWHEADLAGRLLKAAGEGGDEWEILNLPALAGDDDALGRKPGETLCSPLISQEMMEDTKAATPPYWWSALYQQTPTPDEGGIFSRRDFHYFDFEDGGETVTLRRPDGQWQTFGSDWCQKFQVVDLAESEKKTADYTVMAEVWKTPEGDMLVRSIIRDRIPGPDQPKFFRAHHKGMPVKIEAIGYQSSLVNTMLREGFPAEPVYPDKDKVTRASAAGALYKAGKVYHLAGAEWLSDFEAELLSFPAGEHDDQVDTIAYAARALPDIETSTGYKQKERGQTLTGGLMTQQL